MPADLAAHGAAVPASVARSRDPMAPVPHRVVGRKDETNDVSTLSIVPLAGEPARFRPGQFNMLTAYGIGEAAISLSGSGRDTAALRHTVRDVGPVSRALRHAAVGDVVGVRGPFGTDWRVGERSFVGEGDVVVVAGGIGLAPLRGAVDDLVKGGAVEAGRVFVVVGAREPSQVMFGDDLSSWAGAGAHVTVTVDVSAPGWTGHVGLVTSRLGAAGFDPEGASAMICGPEIMIRFTARSLVDRGMDPARILVSLERNMQCGLAWCGHCQLGPLLLCRDGPVVPYAGDVARLMTERER